MTRLGPSSVNEMIAAFVQAEFDSARFGRAYQFVLQSTGRNRSIIDHPDTTNADENRIRHGMLARVRGYPKATLFTRFPKKVTWHLLEFTSEEVGQFWYANWKTWITLSGGTRLVADGAANVDRIEVIEEGTTVNDNIKAVAKRLRNGETFPKIIVVGQRLQLPLVVIEGHTRATAYALVGPDTVTRVRVIAAISHQMDGWWLF